MTDDRANAHAADDPARPPEESDAVSDGAVAADDVAWTSWSNLWQVPTIVASLALIVAGLYMASRDAPENDFGAALDQVVALINDGDLEPARERLTAGIEPHLDAASELERARFHAIQADWIDAFQRAAATRTPDNDRRLAKEYERAAELGLVLSPGRLERWAMALVELGEVDGAGRLLEQLEALSLAGGGSDDVRQRRNRVLRAVIERSLRDGSGSYAAMMDVLDRYGRDELIGLDDRLWALARQAELRLADGRVAEAVDRLLVDGRRLERRAEERGVALGFAELDALLGEGYLMLGRHDYARHHLERALEHASSSGDTRGAVMLVLGQLAVAESRLEAALDHFDAVLQEYPGTDRVPAALLGRAEVRGILGNHEGSLEDYRALRDRLGRDGSRRHVTPQRVMESLLDRHHAAITGGHLERALAHLEVAASLFPPAEVPGIVLVQIGAVHRAIADRMLASAGSSEDPSVPPEIRYEAGEHYRAAADAFVRHLRAVAGAPEADDAWADSLWQAARCYDRSGDVDRAADHYQEYLAGRAEDDPRRPAALRGLAQALHAMRRFDEAIATYETLLERHGRTNEAYASFVPLASAYEAVERPGEARRLLEQVVAGERNLTPDAFEYRDALVQLGKLLHDAEEHADAVSRLDEAARRYPDSPRIHEVRFWLADSHRRLALELEGRAEMPGSTTPSERQDLRQRRDESLRRAATLFAMVKAGLGGVDARRLDHLEQRLLRLAFQYEADCAFDLGDYEQAIGLYEQVVREYPEQHVAMNALVQIVNAYEAIGDRERARAAHTRALDHLARLPDAAFESDEAMLDRTAWQRWLANRPLGQMQTNAVTP